MPSIYSTYDVIVVGAGHAGSEAAGAAVRLGGFHIIDYNEFRGDCKDVLL